MRHVETGDGDAGGGDGEWHWNDDAACVDKPLEWWWPKWSPSGDPDEQQRVEQEAKAYSRARRVCFGCPVCEECLHHAMTFPERDGMWGATTPLERKAAWKKKKKAEGRVGKARLAELREERLRPGPPRTEALERVRRRGRRGKA